MDGESWDLFKKVFGMVLRDYVDPKTPKDVIRGALQGAASSVGPECAYIPPGNVAAYEALAKAGPQLPVYVTKGKDFARVLAVFPGQKADIRPGDALRFIGDESTYDLTYPEVLIQLHGKDDKGIKCTFLNQESWQSTTVTLTRTPPVAPTWTPLPGGDGALAIPCLEAKLASRDANAARACRGTVVVDLRNSASGSVTDAIRWAGDLLGPGRSALFESKRGKSSDPVSGPGYLRGKHIRVLVNKTTARAGEVLASTLAAAGAIVCGEPTFGWAPRFEDYPLQNGGILRIITAYYVAPDGKAMNDHPIRPGISLKFSAAESAAATYERVLKAAPPASTGDRSNGA
jgi:carboxyl-terminal processing protease